MTIRTGMANLIERLRVMTSAGTADFSLAGVTYWDDDQLQDVLDGNATLLENYPLEWLPDTIGGGSIEWHRAKAGNYRDFEETTSGTTQWAIRDATGALQGTANYTPNYINGLIHFATDQGGTIYYLTARSYDLYAAAADVWLKRQAYYADWVHIASDGQEFDWQQAFEHAVTMEQSMRARAGQNKARGAIRTGEFVRSDLA